MGAVSGTTVRSGWPCPGCIVEVPGGSRASRPVPMVVLLHGDEGAPGEINASVGPAALRQRMIVFAPQCPSALGCRLEDGAGASTNSWWGWLQYSRGYSDAWLGDQIERIESTYPVDRRRVYLVGWSGGADYLGWYALEHSAAFAGVAFVSGGVPYHPACPSTRLAGYFLLGAADPRYQSGQPVAVKSILARCGGTTRLVVLPGADHAGAMLALSNSGYATRMLDWLSKHRSAGSG